MERILKSTPSNKLVKWYENRVPKPTIWDHLPSSDPQEFENGIHYYSKESLRKVLYDEQNGKCCYCNKSIQNNHTSIVEHLLPHSVYEHERFNYYNLFLSCDGNSKRETDIIYHCDKLKEDREIRINPSKEIYLKDIIYDEFGGIYSYTLEGTDAINILGLNCKSLINRRKTIISDFIFDSHNNYLKSSKYRNMFFKIVFKSIEFKYQIIYVLLNNMNKYDKQFCLIVNRIYYEFKKLKNLIRIIINIRRYNYKPR